MMKRTVPCLVLFVILMSVVYADFDFIITETTPYDYGIFDLYDQSLLVTGSGVNQIEARESSYVEIRNTSPLSSSGGITGILLDDESNLLYSGGEINTIFIDENATATLKGGQINLIKSLQVAIVGELYGVPIYNKHITLECQPGWSWTYTSGGIMGISGLWANGDDFDIEFIDDADYDPVFENINIVEVPELATLILLGLGGLLIRKRKS